MLASERSSPVAAASIEKPPQTPDSSSQKAVGETAIISVNELAVLEDLPPDGGLRAWLVVFGVACGMGATAGIVTSWGTWQTYYEDNTLQTSSSSNIAWIGSVQAAMSYAPGLVVGRLFDLGYLRLPIFASSALFVVCMFLTAECKQYWQFLLCQGFGVGIASGVYYNIGSMILTHWFKRRLGLAYAIAFAGISICGCIIPIVMRSLLEHMSFAWTMRIVSFITLVLLVPANLTAFGRLPGTPPQDLGPLINISEFKKPVFSIYVVSQILNNLGLSTILTYITDTALGAGIDVTLSYDLVAILNAMSAVGQLMGGLLADRYGPLNVLACATLLIAVVTYAWPFANNVATFVVVAVFFGIGNGGYYASMVQPFELMGSLADVGMRIGMGFTLITIGVITGTPLLGAIFDVTGSYKNVGYCGGSLLALSAAFTVATGHFMPKPEASTELVEKDDPQSLCRTE